MTNNINPYINHDGTSLLKLIDNHADFSSGDKVTIIDVIKSVVSYDATLESTDVAFTIENLLFGKSRLFEPILAYYALSALDNKYPIYVYSTFSTAAQNMEGVVGRAHSDGIIELKKLPISHDVSESLTEKMFNLLDGKTEFTHSLFTQAAAIFLSEDGLAPELKNQKGFDRFLKGGLFGHNTGVLFHEIVHQVMRKIFQHQKTVQDSEFGEYTYISSYPYFNNDSQSQNEYRSAICSTLTNIEAKYLSSNEGDCQDLWNFGQNLKAKLLPGSSNEGDRIDTSSLIHGLKFFGKSILGGTTILSAFSTKTYSAESLDAEFIPRLPELDFLYGAEELISLSMSGRIHYCQYVLPEVITAIQSHPLRDQLLFDSNQDFGCQKIIQQFEKCPAGELLDEAFFA